MDIEAARDEVDAVIESYGAERRIEIFRRRASELAPGEDGRAEFLTSLGGELELVGDYAGAREAILAAIEDGGPTVLEPRCSLLSIELTAGNEPAVRDLLAAFLELARAGSLSVTECQWIADDLEFAERLREAHRWYTIPLRDIDPDDVNALPLGALHGRWRVRRELELPHDAYDEASELLSRRSAKGA
jgi:hypothetical protein